VSQDATDSARVELRLNGSDGVQEAAGAVVRALAAAAGVRPERATRVRAVVEELVREAIARPRASEDGDAAVVRAWSESGLLRIEIADTGLPVTPTESRHAPSRRLAALGFVDELHIRARGKDGNFAECALRLEPLESDLGGEEVLDEDAQVVSEAEIEALEVRPMAAGDAIGLVRCVYRCYGYSYKDSLLYEPRHIAEALRDGHMRSVVAVTPDGDVVGHCAAFVERKGDPVPESGRLVVDPRYRGHHLAERMATSRRALAAEHRLPGIWAEAVTNHPSSQRELIKLGGAEVGLLVGGSPAAVRMAGFANTNDGRRSLIVTYTPLAPVVREIHLPERHAAIVAELATRLGLQREIDTTSAAEWTGYGPKVQATVSTKVTPQTGVAHIRISDPGGDLASMVADELEGLDAFDLGAVHLDVPLTGPGAVDLIEELEALDFAFAAWIPDFVVDGDVVRLQRVGSHPVDVEHVVCARAEGEAIRDYVIGEWHRVRRAGIA
jgi:RimJ/RimL family protein N-acetyltransferase/anti-sigma regulatory factor (Ser/Thr protein kinase)